MMQWLHQVQEGFDPCPKECDPKEHQASSSKALGSMTGHETGIWSNVIEEISKPKCIGFPLIPGSIHEFPGWSRLAGLTGRNYGQLAQFFWWSWLIKESLLVQAS